MNVKQLIAAVAVFAAIGPAFAAEWVDHFVDVVSTKTRAEVIAELEQAQANGSYAAMRSEFVPVAAPLGSTRSRAKVHAEAIESVKKERAGQVTYFGA